LLSATLLSVVRRVQLQVESERFAVELTDGFIALGVVDQDAYRGRPKDRRITKSDVVKHAL